MQRSRVIVGVSLSTLMMLVGGAVSAMNMPYGNDVPYGKDGLCAQDYKPVCAWKWEKKGKKNVKVFQGFLNTCEMSKKKDSKGKQVWYKAPDKNCAKNWKADIKAKLDASKKPAAQGAKSATPTAPATPVQPVTPATSAAQPPSAQQPAALTPPVTHTTFNMDIAGFLFSQPNLNIKVGDTVVWKQGPNDPPHTVTSDSGSELASNALFPGQTYSHTFTKAGSFAYHCNPHPSMKATVNVTE